MTLSFCTRLGSSLEGVEVHKRDLRFPSFCNAFGIRFTILIYVYCSYLVLDLYARLLQVACGFHCSSHGQNKRPCYHRATVGGVAEGYFYPDDFQTESGRFGRQRKELLAQRGGGRGHDHPSRELLYQQISHVLRAGKRRNCAHPVRTLRIHHTLGIHGRQRSLVVSREAGGALHLASLKVGNSPVIARVGSTTCKAADRKKLFTPALGIHLSAALSRQHTKLPGDACPVLRQVTIALADKTREHIPFRQSKLTHFLKVHKQYITAYGNSVRVLVYITVLTKYTISWSKKYSCSNGELSPNSIKAACLRLLVFGCLSSAGRGVY